MTTHATDAAIRASTATLLSHLGLALRTATRIEDLYTAAAPLRVLPIRPPAADAASAAPAMPVADAA